MGAIPLAARRKQATAVPSMGSGERVPIPHRTGLRCRLTGSRGRFSYTK